MFSFLKILNYISPRPEDSVVKSEEGVIQSQANAIQSQDSVIKSAEDVCEDVCEDTENKLLARSVPFRKEIHQFFNKNKLKPAPTDQKQRPFYFMECRDPINYMRNEDGSFDKDRIEKYKLDPQKNLPVFSEQKHPPLPKYYTWQKVKEQDRKNDKSASWIPYAITDWKPNALTKNLFTQVKQELEANNRHLKQVTTNVATECVVDDAINVVARPRRK